MGTPRPLSTGAYAVLRDTPRARNRCAEEWTYLDRYEREVRLWREGEEGFLHAARGLFRSTGRDDRVRGPLMPFDAKVSPRNAAQEEWVGDLKRMIRGGESGVAQAPTGFGKTLCAVMALASAGRKALVVVPKTDLLDQWRRVLVEHTSLTEKTVGLVQADECRFEGCPVTVGMLHSVALIDRYPPELYDAFGVLVLDEVHRVAADLMQEACWRFPALVRLGLSATPRRADGRHRTLRAHVGPVRVKADADTMPFRVVRVFTLWRCPRRPVYDPELESRVVRKVPHRPGRTAHVAKTLGRNPERVAKIVNAVRSALKHGRKVVVFFDTLAHVDAVMLALRQAGVRKVGRYVGGRDSGRQRKARLRDASRKPVVLATYGMMAEGTDLPALDTCILADPRSRVEQVIGRILRERKRKKTPVVVDLVDADSDVFFGYAKTRVRWYERKGAEIRTKGMRVRPRG